MAAEGAVRLGGRRVQGDVVDGRPRDPGLAQRLCDHRGDRDRRVPQAFAVVLPPGGVDPVHHRGHRRPPRFVSTYLATRHDSRPTTRPTDRPDSRTRRPGDDPDVRVRTGTRPVVARGDGQQAMPGQPLLQYQSRRRRPRLVRGRQHQAAPRRRIDREVRRERAQRGQRMIAAVHRVVGVDPPDADAVQDQSPGQRDRRAGGGSVAQQAVLVVQVLADQPAARQGVAQRGLVHGQGGHRRGGRTTPHGGDAQAGHLHGVFSFAVPDADTRHRARPPRTVRPVLAPVVEVTRRERVPGVVPGDRSYPPRTRSRPAFTPPDAPTKGPYAAFTPAARDTARTDRHPRTGRYGAKEPTQPERNRTPRARSRHPASGRRRRGHSQSLRRNARNINEHAVTMTTSTAG